MINPFALGIDIGGSHITGGLVDLNNKELLTDSIQRLSVDSSLNAEVIIEKWSTFIEDIFAKNNQVEKIIGIAVPGPFDYVKGIFLIKDQQKFKDLYGLNIKIALAKQLKISKDNISFKNDAAAFLQGEVFGNSYLNNKKVLGLTLGTGLGSAICIDERAEDADLWNIPFLDGIAEDYLSTRWFLGFYKQITGKTVQDVKELAFKAKSDFKAIDVFNKFGYNLAQFLMPLIKNHDIEAVVIGGNISKASNLFFPSLKNTLNKSNLNVDVSVTKLNEYAALMGAVSHLSSLKNIEQSNI